MDEAVPEAAAPEVTNSSICEGEARCARISSNSTASHSGVCFVFGYGSILNNESRHSTTQGQGQPQEVVQYAHIKASAGYLREWTFRSSTGFTALGIRQVGESGGSR